MQAHYIPLRFEFNFPAYITSSLYSYAITSNYAHKHKRNYFVYVDVHKTSGQATSRLLSVRLCACTHVRVCDTGRNVHTPLKVCTECVDHYKVSYMY